MELQDETIYYLSHGSVKAALLCCLLEIGSPFNWRQYGADIEIDEHPRTRFKESPADSEIWLDGHRRDIVYKPDTLNALSS